MTAKFINESFMVSVVLQFKMFSINLEDKKIFKKIKNFKQDIENHGSLSFS